MAERQPEISVCLAIYLHDLSGGGAEYLQFRLANEFLNAGWRVIILVDQAIGELVPHVPKGCELEILNAPRYWNSVPRLVGFLRRVQPHVLISNSEDTHVTSVLARALARVRTRTMLIQHCAFSEQIKRLGWVYRVSSPLYGMVVSFADAVVSVSNGVADDLAQCAGVPREDITVIHNGVVTANVDRLASAEPAHPWFAGETPVIVAMGRLVPQKDFTTLIAALASVQDSCGARLLVLGEGPMRAELESLATSLCLADRVAFPGFVDNPWPYLSRADLFVLSSRFEGFSNVVAEALACGTPVVSTNCPHGPFEILDGGRYGVLVPVGDPAALGEAILSALSGSVDREQLKRRGRAFNIESCGAAYRELIGRLAPPKR